MEIYGNNRSLISNIDNDICNKYWVFSKKIVKATLDNCYLISMKILSKYRLAIAHYCIKLGHKQLVGESKMSITDYVSAGDVLTPTSKLTKLAQSKQPRVRARVAENPNCSTSLLTRLAKDPNAEVRISVTNNPKVSAKVLEGLTEDTCLDVSFHCQVITAFHRHC